MTYFIRLLIKILLVWLVFQFFAHTLVTFSLGRDVPDMIWAWKEILIAVLWLLVVIDLTKHKRRHVLWTNKAVRFFFVLLTMLVVVSAVLTFVIHEQSLGEFLLAFKYDYVGFGIALVLGLLWIGGQDNEAQKITDRYVRVIKRLLVWGALWWMIVAVKPWAVKYFGYDVYSREGVVGQAPPAAYYTWYHVHTWYTRNTFLFERPISRGFFLIAFFPLFFLWEIRRKPFSETWLWWLLYSMNIITTFSRAAWWAWLVQLVLLIAIVYRKQFWYYAVRSLVPVMAVLGLLAMVGHEQIINRTFSNTGHLIETRKGAIKASMHPWAGRWAAFAGPWSHQTDHGLDYNPENQFLQIALEFGIPVAIGWFVLFAYFVVIGMWPLPVLPTKKNNTMYVVLVAVALGMIGLAIEWLVLHSFSDRMIVYPLMIIAGMALWRTIWKVG